MQLCILVFWSIVPKLHSKWQCHFLICWFVDFSVNFNSGWVMSVLFHYSTKLTQPPSKKHERSFVFYGEKTMNCKLIKFMCFNRITMLLLVVVALIDSIEFLLQSLRHCKILFCRNGALNSHMLPAFFKWLFALLLTFI